MDNKYETMLFFTCFLPMIYAFYQCLTAFDYEKVLRRGKVRELKFILLIISIGFSYLFAEAVVGVVQYIMAFFL
ncbi:MAG: DUF1146 family protein [Bacilli bacterium]|jgi:uncharacterized membrane protein YwzB|nr:DUF1146 family protein [Bacilli bacterium]MDY0064360.1 DUF1146 family protein [Bacilli bacterium]